MVQRIGNALCALAILAASCSRPGSRPNQAHPAATSSGQAIPSDACATSEGCRETGACRPSGSVCEPALLEHCQKSEGCRRDGRCQLVDDGGAPRCDGESHSDCAGSKRCQTERRCFLALSSDGTPNACIEAQLREAQTLPLTERRNGIKGALRVLVDSRLTAARFRDGRGYSLAADEPVAAASIRLQSSSGAVLDEWTVYPVVDVSSRPLGSATDTFLATEHVACSAGRFCGWHTRLFELRSTGIQRLRALGASGAERDIVTTASFASRWTVKRDAKTGASVVVSQEEDPMTSSWIERRFFFADGRWRVSERQASVGDPQMSAEKGQWAGQLD